MQQLRVGQTTFWPPAHSPHLVPCSLLYTPALNIVHDKSTLFEYLNPQSQVLLLCANVWCTLYMQCVTYQPHVDKYDCKAGQTPHFWLSYREWFATDEMLCWCNPNNYLCSGVNYHYQRFTQEDHNNNPLSVVMAPLDTIRAYF